MAIIVTKEMRIDNLKRIKFFYLAIDIEKVVYSVDNRLYYYILEYMKKELSWKACEKYTFMTNYFREYYFTIGSKYLEDGIPNNNKE